MSREAYEAVQDFSNCGDSIGINVLMAIARFVQPGPDGWQEGWVSLREMARLARCDKDTAAAKVHHLETIGEIKTRKEGAGRGTKVWFTLLLPLPERDNNQTLSQPEGDNNQGDNNQTLSQQVKLLSQQIETLSQQVKLLSQLLSQNVPMAPEVEENNTLTPIQEHQEHLEENPPTPLPAPAFPFKPARKNKDITPADARVAAIIRVCGLDVTIPDHVRQAQNAAAQLANYTSEVIQARYTNLNGATGEGWNWYRDDWRGQRGNMPRPSQVVETISQERVTVAPENRQNGNGPADSRPNISKAAASYAEKRRRLLGNQHE